MKRLLTLLLIIPSIAFAQSKKDNRIIVTPADTAGLFNRVVSYLYDKGYSLDNKDSELGFISTQERTLSSDRSTSFIVKVRIKEGIMFFSGELAVNVTMSIGGAKSERSFTDIYYGGMKNSTLRNSWIELDKIAKEFGPVSYGKDY